MTEEELRDHIKATTKPQKAWAQKHGIDPSVVSRVIHGRADAPEYLLTALGIQRVVTYEPLKTKRKS